MEEYLKNISNSTIYKNNYLLAESYKIGNFDPKTINDITGGVIAIIAPTGSGKTILLKDILYHTHTNFKKIILMSETAKLQKDYDFFDRSLIYDHFNEEELKNTWGENSNRKRKEKEKGTLIILDDIINDPAFKKSKVLNDIATGGRLCNIMVILLSQDFNSIVPKVRKNIRIAIAFELASKKERDKFVEQFLSVENNMVGDILFKKITKEKYRSIVVLVHKVGYPIDEKVYSYVANPNVKFSIKNKVDDFSFKPLMDQSGDYTEEVEMRKDEMKNFFLYINNE